MKKFFEEFKAFAMRGNVLDMAVGVVIIAFVACSRGMVKSINKMHDKLSKPAEPGAGKSASSQRRKSSCSPRSATS